MVRFCAFCGKTEGRFIENLCLHCYFKREMGRSVFSIKAALCPSCLSYRVKGKWFKPSSKSLSEIIEEIIEKGIEINLPSELRGAIAFKLSSEPLHLKDGNNRLTLNVSYMEPGLTLEEQVAIVFNFKFETCPPCLKARKEPKEAVLQFRSFNGKIDAQMRKKILSIIEKEARLKGISHKVEEKKRGFDVKLSSQGFARSLAQKMKDLLNADLKETFKLKGIKDERRGILSIAIRIHLGSATRPPTGSKAIAIKHGGEQAREEIETLQLSKKSKYSEKTSAATKKYMVISTTNDLVQLMDLETYAIVEVTLPPDAERPEEGKEVEILIKDGKMSFSKTSHCRVK